VASFYTIGHSTRPLAELIAALQAHGMKTLLDIRAFPASRRLPHFNREALEQTLPATHIRYLWMKSLGGYRKKTRDDSPNTALRSTSFRNYADHMLTPEFEQGMAELVRLAQEAPTAYMCAERLWFRCHRMLVSDWLVAHGHTVWHIDGEGPLKPHRLSADARVEGGQVIYSGQTLFSPDEP
jgi:uncharacterized protein (DUF488 family)